MPFSELFGFAEGKVDASHQRTSNLSADLSFQRDSDCCELVWDNGQIVLRNQSSRDRKGSSSKPQDGKEANKNSKGKFSSIESVMSDFPLSAPPSDMGVDEDDSTVPWLSCPVVEPFNNVYCPDTLPESFAVTGNEFTHSNSLRLQQGSTSKIPSTARNSEASSDMKSHKINAGTQPNTASGLTNFSYFSRLGSLSGVNKGGTLHGHNNHMESVPPKSDTIPPEQSAAICQEPDEKCEKSSDKSFCSVPTKLVVVGEKTPEPVVAASSVCSGNSLERDSDDPANSLKRKFRETGDSEGPSEEVEEESVGVHQTARNRAGSKRSRAAEVHNLSERRRRERINERMRSLQELIPNCNKVDKASMLDEAIEYLKTLQLQVQLLSMGTGMYMSQMMLPAAAMQHMHIAHMSQFSPMGIGMGSPLGFGMSMPDMMQMSSIQPPCFPVSGPPISSSSGFYGGMSSSHLGQGLSISTPHAPLPPLGGIPMRLPMGNVSGIPVMADVLANNSMNQGPNQATMVLNDQSRASNVDESQHANALNHIKHI